MKKVLLSCVVGLGLAFASAVSAATPEPPPGFINTTDELNSNLTMTMTDGATISLAGVQADTLRSTISPADPVNLTSAPRTRTSPGVDALLRSGIVGAQT